MNWTRGRKSVEVARHHRVHCPAVSSSFTAPKLDDQIEFDRYELLLSIGRALAMRTASLTMIKALAAGRSPLLKHLVDNSDAPFQLSNDVADLSDSALTSLSHDIGVGVSGLHMERMGFTWRANGKEVLTPGGRMPDYVWDTGVVGGGAVLSEAKGSTSVSSDFEAIDGRARDGLFGQVIPRIGETTLDGDEIVSGYAFGVFAPGGRDARTAAYETMDFADEASSPPGDTPSMSILRSHFRGVMRLLGLEDDEVVPDLSEGRVAFEVFGDDRRLFVRPERWPDGRALPVRFDTSISAALSVKVASLALGLQFGLAGLPTYGRARWPRIDVDPENLPRGVLAVAPDGLALISNHARRRGARLMWNPDEGFVSRD